MTPHSKLQKIPKLDVTVRPLRQSELTIADTIMRLAFGTFIGLPEPMSFMGDADYVSTRWHANPAAAFAAEVNGEVIGSNFATNWGSIGFFGPLTVRPDFWGRGVAKRLMEPVMELFSNWGTRHAGLFTFAQSQKHVGLYQSFGFWPRFLTAIMSKPIEHVNSSSEWSTFSEVPTNERQSILTACRELTGEVFEGLDVAEEIAAIATQNLGDTILLWNGNRLAGIAVCHVGPSTEAGSGVCYMKFGVVRPGPTAEQDFLRLMDACEEMASRKLLTRLSAGVNTARHEAYRYMLSRGFRTDIQGVVMSRPNESGYNRPGVFLIDDWR